MNWRCNFYYRSYEDNEPGKSDKNRNCKKNIVENAMPVEFDQDLINSRIANVLKNTYSK